MQSKISNIEFYERIYLDELNRKNVIDNSITYPTTIMSFLVAGGFYIFKLDDFKLKNEDSLTIFIIMIVLSACFFATMSITLSKLMRMYLNIFKKYHYLPSPLDLRKREKQLFDHYLNFYEDEGVKKAKQKAIKSTKKQFQNDLLNYYIDFASTNQKVNDNRLKMLYKAKLFILFSIIFIGLTGILLILK